MDALAGAIVDIVSFGLDDRYYDTFADKVRAQTIPDSDRGGSRGGSPR